MRRVLAVVVAHVVLVGGVTSTAAARPADRADPPLAWSPPVDAPVDRGFVPGVGPFEVTGHAGVDYRVATGVSVRAAGDGVVAFTGEVAGTTFAVVAHGGGVRTTYGQLESVTVRRGRSVARGEEMGVAGGGGMHGHDAGVLHFGLRVDGRPVDPRVLFAPPDLTRIVRLVPSEVAAPEIGSPQEERRLAASWFSPPGIRPRWLFGAGEGDGLVGNPFPAFPGAAASAWQLPRDAATTTALAAVQALGSDATAAVGELALRWAVRGAFVAVLARPLPPDVAWDASVALQEIVWEGGRGVRDWWKLRHRCTTPPAAATFTGTGNRLMVVAGVNSAPRSHRGEHFPPGSTMDLPVAELGYVAGEVDYFSYADDGGRYRRTDTHVGPAIAADRLAAQLRALGRARPGEAVDLIGHSQGGVVVEVFLKHHWARDPAAYPPLGKVVTLAAPHRGAALAGLAGAVAETPLAPTAELVAEAAGMPSTATATTRDLATGSAFLEALAAEPLPTGVEMTTVGGADDVLVTADATRVDGATHLVVDPDGLLDHGAILTDPEALDAVRSALAGLPPPCAGLLESVRNRTQPRALRAVVDLVTACVERSASQVARYTAPDSGTPCA